MLGKFNQSGNSYSFAASGDHTVMLSGNRVQSVYFSNNETSDFKDLIINNPYGIVYSNDVKVTIFSILGNFFLGVVDGAKASVTDLCSIVSNPGKIVDGVEFLLQCLIPGEEGAPILDLIANSIADTIKKFENGNLNTRARMVGKLVGEVIVGLIADKGVTAALNYLKGTFILKVNNALEKGEDLGGVKKYIDDVVAEGAGKAITADEIQFSDKFSKPQYINQVSERGWTNESIANTINNPYKTGTSINKYTDNSVTVYYVDDVHYVAVDDVTGKVIQVADLAKPDWVLDLTI